MPAETISADILKYVLSGISVAGICGYVLHTFLTSHREFKKDVYDKLGKKVEKEDCKDFRRGEK